MRTEISTTTQQAVVLLEPRDRQQLDSERSELLAIQLPAEIVSPAEYEAIAAEQARIDKFVKRAKPAFDDVCDSAHKTWKQACGLRSLFFDALDSFNSRARRLLGDYTAKQERIRRQEEERIRAEEQKRLEEERDAKAKQLARQGQKDAAAVVKNTPVQAPVTVLESQVPKVEGLTFREDWKWRPIAGDTPAGRKAAAQIVPREYVKLDDVALNSLAKNMKGTVKVPGIEFYMEKTPVRR